MAETAIAESTPRNLFTVKQMSALYPAWTQAALRNLILNAQDRHSSRGLVAGNGLQAAAVIVRVGRRVLLDPQAFFRWIAAQQRPRIAARDANAAP